MFIRIESYRTETLKGMNPWEADSNNSNDEEGLVGNLERSKPGGRSEALP